MNPIWNYVKQVERSLPKRERAAIVGELYAGLKAKRKALEASLGRKASEAEVARMLAEEGEPSAVAARFTARSEASHPLVERYLAAVQLKLPQEGVHDVLAELREAIGDKIEARENELGRRLEEAEIAEIIRAFGHPVMAASRFAGHEYLVGPGLYPWFWPTQRTVIGVVLALVAVLGGLRALASDNPWRVLPQTMENAWQLGVFAFGMVTVVFVLIERCGQAPKTAGASKWDPRSLPRDEVRKPKSLFESVVGLAFDIIFILWWVRAVPFPNQWPVARDVEAGLHFSSAWDAVWWPILALALVQAATHLADIFHPAWSRVRALVVILAYMAGLGVMWVLVRADELVVVSVPEGHSGRTGLLSWLLDGPFHWTLAVIAVFWAIGMSAEVWRLVQSSKDAAPRRLNA